MENVVSLHATKSNLGKSEWGGGIRINIYFGVFPGSETKAQAETE